MTSSVRCPAFPCFPSMGSRCYEVSSYPDICGGTVLGGKDDADRQDDKRRQRRPMASYAPRRTSMQLHCRSTAVFLFLLFYMTDLAVLHKPPDAPEDPESEQTPSLAGVTRSMPQHTLLLQSIPHTARRELAPGVLMTASSAYNNETFPGLFTARPGQKPKKKNAPQSNPENRDIPIILARGVPMTHYNPFYPSCPKSCLAGWIGDGWCDTDCAVESCGNDGGDCEGWCAPDCRTGWIGDGFCDVDCFRPECQHDGGDCDKLYTKTQLKIPLPPHSSFDYKDCPEACNRELLHNGVCDPACHTPECNMDGGDCRHQCSPTCATVWLGDGDCDVGCNTEVCGFDKGDCKMCGSGCEPGMVGNGVCDTQCNNEECHYDMGDCYGVCWAPEKIDYFAEPFFYPHCRDEWKGDGYCDCFCNTDACQHDFGDCHNTTISCSDEYSRLAQADRRLNISSTPRFPVTPSRRLYPQFVAFSTALSSSSSTRPPLRTATTFTSLPMPRERFSHSDSRLPPHRRSSAGRRTRGRPRA